MATVYYENQQVSAIPPAAGSIKNPTLHCHADAQHSEDRDRGFCMALQEAANKTSRAGEKRARAHPRCDPAALWERSAIPPGRIEEPGVDRPAGASSTR